MPKSRLRKLKRRPEFRHQIIVDKKTGEVKDIRHSNSHCHFRTIQGAKYKKDGKGFNLNSLWR